MAMDFQMISKMMNAKNQFEQTHPKFAAFVTSIARSGIEVGSVIEIKITKPDGTDVTANMRVQQSDLDLVNTLKEMGMQ